MKRLENHLIGIDQGDEILFSDFQDGGEMWTGRGQRERRRRVLFSEEFRAPPNVHVSISMWDVDTKTALRADVAAEEIDAAGFDLVFRTWGDTRVARVRVAWIAMGEMPESDEWDIY
ncbi:H-type lectin domain-containing protein [uncultured Tateyamaria sp.]|uniref:H-type lectin domain-containing protein n=1 Tax=uncultured Tateyamaria sp. TaxID=455651 RepID=UPI00263530F8|nr:H-type lectin domain-containing protein [uncultured Tateyamaria sp.]